MILRFGEVVPIRMEFHQTTGAKVRPAVVLLDTGDDDFVAAPITSPAIEDWRIGEAQCCIVRASS